MMFAGWAPQVRGDRYTGARTQRSQSSVFGLGATAPLVPLPGYILSSFNRGSPAGGPAGGTSGRAHTGIHVLSPATDAASPSRADVSLHSSFSPIHAHTRAASPPSGRRVYTGSETLPAARVLPPPACAEITASLRRPPARLLPPGVRFVFYGFSPSPRACPFSPDSCSRRPPIAASSVLMYFHFLGGRELSRAGGFF